MKKILAFLMVAVLAFSVLAMVGCGETETNEPTKEEILNSVSVMYSASQPKMTVGTTTQSFGDTVLVSSYTLKVGYVGGKRAAVRETVEQEMRTVKESDDSKIVLSPVKETTEKREYIEGEGVRINGGSWRKNEDSIIPERGHIALNLDPALIENVSFANNTLTFTVDWTNASAVLGVEGVYSDLTVMIATDGTVIMGISIEYVVPADDELFVEETTVSIVAEYTYDNQSITIE